jgi:hypothetical protein
MRNLAKVLALSLSLVWIPVLAFGLTYTTPNTTDGVVENSAPALGGTTWESDEVMANDGGTFFHLTWDDSTVYVAVTGTYANQEDGQYDWFIAFDTDMTADSGATSDGYGQVTFSGNYLPEFVYYFAGGMGWYESSNWTGSEWNWRGWSANCSYGGWSGNLASELCIPRSMIGDPESFAVVSWISTEDNSSIVASFPTANPIGAKPQAMTYFWVAANLGQGIAPNTLPVMPTPPSALVDNERSFPHTCTVMADITPGNCGSTTSMVFYYTTDGSTPTEASSFVVGTYDTCRTGADSTDTFYGVIPAPDDSTVKWIAKGIASNSVSDVSDAVQSFVQGGTAWVGNAGASPTDCTIWAEIFVGDGGQTTWVDFKYTTDLSDPRTSGTAVLANGVFDSQQGNNDKFYAVLSSAPAGSTVNWYAYGRDVFNNYAQTDTFYTFVQGDTARIYNLLCAPDSNFVQGDVVPKGYGAGMNFIWTTDGSDPTTSPTSQTAHGFFVAEGDSEATFAAYLTASVGQTIRWYVHAWGGDNSYNDSDVQSCVAGTTSGPILCDLTCVPESLIVRAGISPRGFGAEIDFIYTHDGSDPKTSPTAYRIHGSYLEDADSPGDCEVPVGIFQAELYALSGETIRWFAHGWYQPHNMYNGLVGNSEERVCVADTSRTGVEPRDVVPGAIELSNAPNPFAGTTEIRFALPEAARVSVAVYDASGRLVARVADKDFGQGEHRVVWDGRTASGQDVPSGIYFYMLEAGGHKYMKKAVIVR